MFEKDLSIGLLLDTYSAVLNDHTRDLMQQYYHEDLSLSEIAENTGISRQGVRQAIKKGEEQLRFLEEGLGLAAFSASLNPSAEKMAALLAAIPEEDRSPLEKEAGRCVALILNQRTGG